jgi:poly-gamma-glutamate synthesis protein (capsule biosynthesis protein)
VSSEQKTFAHALVAEAGVDVVHGHSSHHPIGIEVYEGRLIVYGAGDFYNDYEGIGGYEQFRGDLALMYLARVQPATGRLLGLDMVPFKLRRFRLERAAPGDAAWLAETLSRASEGLGTSVKVEEGGRLELVWKEVGD